MLGAANPSATATVNLKPTYRKGEFYRAEYPLNNSTGSVWLTLTNVGVLANGTNADIVTTNTGALFVPKTPELFTYDLDGNLKSDGHWTNFWDGENRLIQMDGLSTVPTPARQRLVFSYDTQGRRIRKTVYNWNTGSSSFADVASDTKFVYDGWNLVGELNGTNNALICSYMWGTDLSGSMQGAGGVGGLLYSQGSAGGGFSIYDGNGDVIASVLSHSGTNLFRTEYSPFGSTIAAPNRKVGSLFLGTKYQDEEAQSYNFGFRHYDVGSSRWQSRDPINEYGGANLYAFVRNDPAGRIDPDGRFFWLLTGCAAKPSCKCKRVKIDKENDISASLQGNGPVYNLSVGFKSPVKFTVEGNSDKCTCKHTDNGTVSGVYAGQPNSRQYNNSPNSASCDETSLIDFPGLQVLTSFQPGGGTVVYSVTFSLTTTAECTGSDGTSMSDTATYSGTYSGNAVYDDIKKTITLQPNP